MFNEQLGMIACQSAVGLRDFIKENYKLREIIFSPLIMQLLSTGIEILKSIST